MVILDTFEPVNVVQSYDIYGVLGFMEGFRGKVGESTKKRCGSNSTLLCVLI